MIHRDLKPGSVLQDEEGNAYLPDFGVAKDLDATETMTAPGAVAPGSPAYMTPEQMEGDPVTARTDICAFGLLLHECLAGHHPFDSDSLMNVITSRCRSRIRSTRRSPTRSMM
jgi:serine/threonine protein kinase